jgi:hypothetical protein
LWVALAATLRANPESQGTCQRHAQQILNISLHIQFLEPISTGKAYDHISTT